MTVSEIARRPATRPALAVLGTGVLALGVATAPTAAADYRRLNSSVAQSVYAIKHQAGCTTDLKMNRTLDQAAQWHADDLLNNRNLDGDVGSDGSSVQDRAQAAGYNGTVAETVAVQPSAVINGIDILGNWYYRPDYMAIMSNCANIQIGVWTDSALDRSVTVAVYGQPSA